MTVIDQAHNLRALVARQARRRAAVYAITSGKGGVGKTNVAINLAIQFAQAGRTVILLDADMGLANCDVLLNVDLPYNLAHVVAGRKQLHEVMVEAPGGFRLIGGASGLARMADLSDYDRRRLVESLGQLEQQADVLLIDTGAGINPNVLCFTRAADNVVIVTTPEPTAMTDAYAVAKVISRDAGSRRLSLLVNQAASGAEARGVYERIARVARDFLRLTVYDAGYVLEDSHVAASVRRRVPFVLAWPQCPAARCIAQVAGRFHHGVAVPAAEGFFQRIARWLGKS